MVISEDGLYAFGGGLRGSVELAAVYLGDADSGKQPSFNLNLHPVVLYWNRLDPNNFTEELVYSLAPSSAPNTYYNQPNALI